MKFQALLSLKINKNPNVICYDCDLRVRIKCEKKPLREETNLANKAIKLLPIAKFISSICFFDEKK